VIDGMSREAFDANRADIDTQISTILATQGKTRRRFRLRAIYERRSSELVAELFATTHGPVLVMLDAEYGGASRHVANDIRARGRDIAPLTGDPAQQFLVRARSRSYLVTGAHLAGGTYPDNLLVIK
jgi:hypothetical protein